MSLKRTSLVLYILFIFQFHHTFPSVSSLPSSVDTNHDNLPLIDVSSSKADVISFEGKARELAVVIKRGGGRGGGGGGRSSSGGRSSRSSGVGRRVVPTHTAAGAGAGRSHSSSGRLKIAVGWLGLSILAGLLLV